VCGAELDVGVLFAHETDQRALARLAAVSIPLGARVMQYVALFTPPKTRLTAAKKIKLLLQLLPDLERQAIHHKGRDWSVPLDAWALAFDQMLASRDAGRLELPMKGHGYLYTTLAGMADKHEAAAEAQREAERRTAPRQDTVQVRGQTLPIGEALQVAYAGKDPALAEIDARTGQAAPMPAEVRARLAALKKGQP
jgi:hypothetical protein